MMRGKKELAEQIIPKLREVEVEVGRGKTVAESLKKIGVTERLSRCSRPTVLFVRWRQHTNTIWPHSALGYRPPTPPRAFAWRKPQQTHSAGLLEGKILT